jgi:hypothetical protein
VEVRVDDNFECLLELSCARAEKLAAALERNWTIHLILAGVGLAIVFDVGNLPEFLVKHFVEQDTFERRPVAAILLPLVLFYFMKLGHLLTSFFETRDLVVFSVQKYGGESDNVEKLSCLQGTTSFFEVFARGSRASEKKTLRYAAMGITSVVFSTEQATALYLLVQAYGINLFSVIASILSLIALFILYVTFWNSPDIQKTDGKKVTAISCSLLILGTALLLYFHPR